MKTRTRRYFISHPWFNQHIEPQPVIKKISINGSGTCHAYFTINSQSHHFSL